MPTAAVHVDLFLSTYCCFSVLVQHMRAASKVSVLETHSAAPAEFCLGLRISRSYNCDPTHTQHSYSHVIRLRVSFCVLRLVLSAVEVDAAAAAAVAASTL